MEVIIAREVNKTSILLLFSDRFFKKNLNKDVTFSLHKSTVFFFVVVVFFCNVILINYLAQSKQ